MQRRLRGNPGSVFIRKWVAPILALIVPNPTLTNQQPWPPPKSTFREAERIQQAVQQLTPSTCKHQIKGIPESWSSIHRA